MLAATPLLLSLAGCLLVMRAYPWVLGRVLARASRWRGPTALLGTARALRDPAAGLAAALALVTGVSLAVFSGVATSTLQHGLADAAEATVGADVVVEGQPLNPRIQADAGGPRRRTRRRSASPSSPACRSSRPTGRPSPGCSSSTSPPSARSRRMSPEQSSCLPGPRSSPVGIGPSILVVAGLRQGSVGTCGSTTTPVDVVGTASACPLPLSPLTLVGPDGPCRRAALRLRSRTAGPPPGQHHGPARDGPRRGARASREMPRPRTTHDVARQPDRGPSPLVPGIRHAAHSSCWSCSVAHVPRRHRADPRTR